MYGYGYSYPNNPQGSGLMGRYEAGVRSDGGSFAFPIDTGLASRLEGLGLLNASSLVNSCNAGKESVLYNLIPTPVQSLDRFAVTRSTVKWVLGANGVLTSIPANTPAFEFNTDGTYRGLLVEPAGTNLATYSSDFTQGTWAKTVSGAVTGDTGIAPDGTMTADTFSAGANGSQIQLAITGTAGIAYTASFWVRRVTGSGVVNIRAVENVNTPIAVTSSWQRFSLSAVSSTTTIRIGLTLSTSGDAVEIWGAQLETGSVATSYIPTVASTQTRTADSVTLTGASSLIGQSVFSMYVEYDLRTVTTSDNACIFAMTDGTANNMAILRTQTDGDVELFVRAGGADQATIASTLDTGILRIAHRVKSNDAVLYINGTQIGTDASVVVPALDRFQASGTIATYAPIARPFHIRGIVSMGDVANATLATLTT